MAQLEENQHNTLTQQDENQHNTLDQQEENQHNTLAQQENNQLIADFLEHFMPRSLAKFLGNFLITIAWMIVLCLILTKWILGTNTDYR